MGFRARVQGEGLVHGVWNKGSEDVENQFGRLLWSSENVQCKVPNIFWTNLGGIPFQALCLGVSDKGSGKRLKAWVSSNGPEGRENVIWQAALGIHRKCMIQGSKCSV